MEIRNLNLSSHTEVSFVENLYIASFPLSERRPVDKMLELYKDNPLFIISVIAEDDKLLGFLTYWDLNDFIFAEHFAISPDARNGGYGRRAMDIFKNVDKPIVLEVELPATIMSERRIGFYQRIGYKLWDNVQYQQPSYHEAGGTIPMKLMSYGDIDIEKDLTEIRSKIYSTVYNC